MFSNDVEALGEDPFGRLPEERQDAIMEAAAKCFAAHDYAKAKTDEIASKGNRQKAGIVCAFMGNPDVLLLDEPTSGLDPIMQERFIGLMASAKERGATVFLSSHIFEEVMRICDRVAFIGEGRMAATKSLEDLRVAGRAFEIEFASAEARRRYLEHHPEGEPWGRFGVRVAPRDGVDPFIKDLASYGAESLKSLERTLEDVFMDLYAENGNLL